MAHGVFILLLSSYTSTQDIYVKNKKEKKKNKLTDNCHIG